MALAIDGTAAGQNSTGSGTAVTSGPLTTANANDIIIAVVFLSTGGLLTTESVSATGLSFSQRSATVTLSLDLEVWYAVASSPFSGTVTCNYSAAVPDAIILVFGVSGANTASPWDTNVSIPAVNNGASGIPTVTGVSTSNANDMLLGFVGQFNGVQTAGGGYSIAMSLVTPIIDSAYAEYQLVSSTQSGVSVAFGTSAAHSWIMIADAIVAGPSAASSVPFGIIGSFDTEW